MVLITLTNGTRPPYTVISATSAHGQERDPKMPRVRIRSGVHSVNADVYLIASKAQSAVTTSRKILKGPWRECYRARLAAAVTLNTSATKPRTQVKILVHLDVPEILTGICAGLHKPNGTGRDSPIAWPAVTPTVMLGSPRVRRGPGPGGRGGV